MSEAISIEEQQAEPTSVVELGTASEKTRGTSVLFGLFDPYPAWPFIFYR